LRTICFAIVRDREDQKAVILTALFTNSLHQQLSADW
jgi:hypothetical protein